MSEISFGSFEKEFSELKKPSCLPQCFEELCGGCNTFILFEGTLETLKQILHKLTKKHSIGLPLYFDSPVAMDGISNKKLALGQVFNLLDYRGNKLIDGTEFFAVVLWMCAGDFSSKVQTIIEIFGGMEEHEKLSFDEAFYFLDALFRAVSKVAVKKNKTKIFEKRVLANDLKKQILLVFENEKNFLKKDELVDSLAKLLEQLHKDLSESLIFARENALIMMKIKSEVKRTMIDIIVKVEKSVKK